MFQKKQIFKLSYLKKLLSDENGCVSLVPSTRLLALPPFFLNDMKSGILYLLNYMLKKYDRSLGGIVIGYQNIKVLMDENTGIIPMGTPEIEVNISVEFYIFQPKIGSLLEGIINKKSNSHIGCLVHQYFNATILKPEDVDFDDWICKDFNVDDKIIFKVKDLDFTSLLPYIEGMVDEDFLHKTSSRKSEKSDISDVNNKNVQDISFTEESSNRIESDDLDGEFVKKAKCQSSKGEDNILYSTQLESKLDSKMMISCCSPIPSGPSSGVSPSNLSVMRNSQSEVKGMEKEKKKKHKRKRKEDEDEGCVKKRMKVSSTFCPEVEDSNTKMSETDKLIEELCKEQINRTMGNSAKGSEKVNCKRKKSPKKDTKQQRKEELSKDSDEKISEKQNASSGPGKQDFSDGKELNAAGKKPKEDTSKKSSRVKKDNEFPTSSSGEEKNTKKELNAENDSKGKQKPKPEKTKKDASREGIDHSPSKKTTKEATGDVISENYVPPISGPEKTPEKMSSKRDGELSDLSTGTSKKRHSKKKSKHREKLKDNHEAQNKYKNGSMYDVVYSPEKLHPDKSLFTDSEQSHTSPAKKGKEVNGIEAIFGDKSRVQNDVTAIGAEKLSRTKSESVGEVSKDSVKNEKNAKKSKRKVDNPDQRKQSLYEKLLEQARRLIDMKGDSSSEKKGKSGSGSRKQSTA